MALKQTARAHGVPIGRRERNKRDKRERIEEAARRLFARHGFEATTIRQIAAAADIGLGTVFSYAANKSDLFVLIFQEDVGRAVERAFAKTPDKPLLDKVLHVLGAIAAHHRAHRGLARAFVKETPFIDDRRHGIADFMQGLLGGLAEFVEEAKRRGEMRADVPAVALVRNLFGIFFQHLQIWLRGDGDLDERQLRAALELQLTGLRATTVPPATAGTRTRAATGRARAGNGGDHR